MYRHNTGFFPLGRTQPVFHIWLYHCRSFESAASGRLRRTWLGISSRPETLRKRIKRTAAQSSGKVNGSIERRKTPKVKGEVKQAGSERTQQGRSLLFHIRSAYAVLRSAKDMPAKGCDGPLSPHSAQTTFYILIDGIE